MSEGDMECTPSLLEALEAQGGFQPLTARKRMAVGEGLNKIWMCSNDEMAAALFSSRPKEVKNWAQATSLNVVEKLTTDKRFDGDQTASHQLDHSHSDVLSASRGVSSDSDESDDDYSSDEESSEEEEEEEQSVSSEESISDEKIERLKDSLKTMYREKLTAGASMILAYSLRTLDSRMYSLIKDIRREEQERIDREIKPILDFMERYRLSVNRENGAALKKKYKILRRHFISRLINTAEESFACHCTQIEKELKNKYYFRVSMVRNKNYAEYKDKLKIELDKLVTKMKEEKKELIDKHQKNVNEIKDRFSAKYENLEAFEKNKVKEEISRIKQVMLEIEEANRQEPRDPNEKCSEVAGWLCILQQLLPDMQQFIRKYINSQADLRLLLKKLLQQRSKAQTASKDLEEKVKLMDKVEDVIMMHIRDSSMDSVPCIPGRDDKLHRALLEEAEAIINSILSSISKGEFDRERIESEYEMYRSPTIDEMRVSESPLRHFPSDEDRSLYSKSSYNITEPSEGIEM